MPKYVDGAGLSRFWDNIKDQIGSASQEQVDAWLDEHPEATTTVENGSLTGVKLADDTIPDSKLVQTGGVLEEVYYSDGTYKLIETTTDDKHYYIANTQTGLLMYAANQYANTTVVPCKYGDKFKVSFRHMTAVAGIFFTDDQLSAVYGSLFPAGTASAVETDYLIEVTDAECKNIIINGTSGYGTSVKKYKSYTVKDKIADLKSAIYMSGNVYTVSPSGHCDFTTIQAAVDGTSDGDTILIYPATYNEQVVMTGKVRHLVGVDKATCIISDDSSDYRTPPLWMGAGSVQNLTIIETHENPDSSLLSGTDTDGKDFNYQRAYSIHVEDAATCDDTDAVTLIDNCILRNAKRCCLGMGTYQGHTIIVRDCDMWSGESDRAVDVNRGVVYFHSRSNDNAATTGQKVRLINNTGYSDTNLTLFIGDSARFTNQDSELSCEFINNMFYSSVIGKTDSTVGGNTFPSDNVTLEPSSYGNNIAKLNA